VSRGKKGGAWRRKAIALLAKAHLMMRRQSTDFHHKTALQLAREYDTIYHEDLPVRAKVKITISPSPSWTQVGEWQR
jgi:putative transposase